MGEKALVSVVIPCYNSGKTLIRAIKSVVEQSYLPLEIIIIDDYSTDKGATLKSIKAIKEKYDKIISIIILENKNNRGVAYSRNRGWNIAKGKYVAFLDSDDAWHHQKIEIQYRWMEQNPSCVLSGHVNTQIQDVKFDDFTNSKVNLSYVQDINFKKLMLKNYLPTPTIMLVKDLPFRFLSGRRYGEDQLLWMQISYNYPNKIKFLHIDLSCSFKSNFGESGLSSDLWNMEECELENFNLLYKDKYISFFEKNMFKLFSVIKYFRRIIISKINILKRMI